MGARGIYDNQGNPITGFSAGGRIDRVHLTVAGGWAEVPLSPACDLVLVIPPAGARRVVWTDNGNVPGIAAGQAVSPAARDRAFTVNPPGMSLGVDRPSTLRFFIAVDPEDVRVDANASPVVEVVQVAEA